MIGCMVNGKDPYPDLDWLCVDILKAIAQHGGTATTTEVRDAAGAETRFKVHYRVNGTLEPSGFVSTHQPEGGPGKTPPKELTITEAGEEVLGVVSEEEKLDQDLAERVDNLEGRVDAMQGQLTEINQKLDNLNVDGFMDLIETVEELESAVDEVRSDLIFDERLRKQLNSTQAVAGLVKDDWVDERGGKEVSNEIGDKMDDFKTFDV